MVEEEKISFSNISRNIDNVINQLEKQEATTETETISRIKFATDIKNHPPKKGFMKVDVPPAIYSIDLNTDADWWFSRSSTVFPLLLDQAKRTHIDIKDSFKAEKRYPDFPYMFLFVVIIGVIGLLFGTKMFGLW